MKILVFAHRLELGGTQTNAIELAAAVRTRHGHEVTLVAAPGPAAALAAERSVRYLPVPAAEHHPSPRVVRAVDAIVRREQPDILHVWDWPQCFDAYPTHLARKTPMLCTVMSMTVPEFLPRSIPTTFGTSRLVAEARLLRSGSVDLLEPPVDIVRNAPGAVDAGGFRTQHDLDPDAMLIVIVSRLVSWLKLEGIRHAIDAMLSPALAGAQLVIVGGGDAAGLVDAHARQTNASAGRRAVVLTGPLVDPRPAYASADVVVGMGSSALRAAAWGKALIVVGEEGFSEVFDPETADLFLWQGFYGLGDGDRGASRLRAQLEGLTADDERRAELGAFGRRVVEQRFGLDAAADRLEAVYRAASTAPVERSVLVREGARLAAWRGGSRVLPARARTMLAPLKRA